MGPSALGVRSGIEESLRRMAETNSVSGFRLIQNDSSTPSSHCSSVAQNIVLDSCRDDSRVNVFLQVYLARLFRIPVASIMLCKADGGLTETEVE